jgi:hypothetical protein
MILTATRSAAFVNCRVLSFIKKHLLSLEMAESPHSREKRLSLLFGCGSGRGDISQGLKILSSKGDFPSLST